MKFTLLTLALLTLTFSANAEMNNDAGKCLDSLHRNIDTRDVAQLKPQYLMQRLAEICMPEQGHIEDPQYFKLLQIINNNRSVSTLKA